MALKGMKQQKNSNRSYWLAPVCLLVMAACNNDRASSGNAQNKDGSSDTIVIPAPIRYEIVNQYPHDPNAFTEGLEFKDGVLYESTGQYGNSDIRKVDLRSGKVLLSRKLENRYFGEGLTVLNEKIYQLTYREGKGFVYDAAKLKLEQTFSFNASEGWGMTNNGAHLIFDDGGSIFHFLDPATFREIKQLRVTDEYGPVKELNEPEMIKGFIYANVWRTDMIVKIDTATGHVVGRVDLSDLRHTVAVPPPTGISSGPEVLNGIAYDADSDRIFITGKYWPKLLEIKLDN